VVQPRGIVNGIDFGSTGEVKKIDVVRIKERLENNCIVMLSNLGYSGQEKFSIASQWLLH
jgi:amino-acid N-acetyltransferase